MNVDGSRQRDPVDRQFLIMDTISRKPGEQDSDQRNKADDETQPNHSLTQTEGIGNEAEEPFDGR
jgi:hypothetical protein